jgi:hypothetical protein
MDNQSKHHYLHATHTQKINGLIAFFHVTTTPPIRQNGPTDRNITSSMPPIGQNGSTNSFLARNHHATHTLKWTDQSEHHYTMPPIRQNGWTNNILARDHNATDTSRWTTQSEYHYLHATPYAK